MVQAVGIDIVDISRFKKSLERWQGRFIERIFTQQEREYCQKKLNAEHSLAARFAAKEAMIKCLRDRDQVGFHWHDMEVLNTASGRPVVYVYGKLALQLANTRVKISLSHSVSSAVAVIILEEQENK